MTLPKLFIITDRFRTNNRPLASILHEASHAARIAVIIREKDLSEKDYLTLYEQICTQLAPSALPIISARPDCAARLNTWLHLPESQKSTLTQIDTSRTGLSVHSITTLCNNQPAYWLAGTIFPTASKPNQAPQGSMFIKQVVAAAGEVPVIAIGGITRERIAEVRDAGAYGVAVCGAVLESNNPARAVEELSKA